MQGNVAQPTNGPCPWVGFQHLACATVARCGNMTCAGMEDETYLGALVKNSVVVVVRMMAMLLLMLCLIWCGLLVVAAWGGLTTVYRMRSTCLAPHRSCRY